MNTTTDPRGGWTSASNAHADSLCAGRHLAQRGLPEETSEDAEAGTNMHSALATNNDAGLSGDEQDTVERMRADCLKLANAWLVGKAMSEVVVEERMWITDPDTGFRHSGQPDYVVFAESQGGMEALIVDYKTGRIAVEDPAENAQLRDLVVLADARVGGKLVSATVQIIQPFAGQFTPTVYDGDAISRASEELLARIRRSNDPKSPRVAGEAQCKYCRARARCPEFEAWATAPLPKPLTPVNMQEALARMDDMLPAIGDEKLANLLSVAGLAEKFFNLLRVEARKRLTANPASLPGWQLKSGQTRAAVTEIREVWRRWDHSWPDTTEQFLAATKIGKGDLKEALRAVSGLKGRALTEAFDSLIAGCTTETITAPRLIRVGEEDAE